MSNVVTFSRPS